MMYLNTKCNCKLLLSLEIHFDVSPEEIEAGETATKTVDIDSEKVYTLSVFDDASGKLKDITGRITKVIGNENFMKHGVVVLDGLPKYRKVESILVDASTTMNSKVFRVAIDNIRNIALVE